jgi:hypothetical protein
MIDHLGWFVLDVMREKARKSDWVAIMIDVDLTLSECSPSIFARRAICQSSGPLLWITAANAMIE